MSATAATPIQKTYIHGGALAVSSQPINPRNMALRWHRGFFRTLYVNLRSQNEGGVNG
jgi:hypothetical protein